MFFSVMLMWDLVGDNNVRFDKMLLQMWGFKSCGFLDDFWYNENYWSTIGIDIIIGLTFLQNSSVYKLEPGCKKSAMLLMLSTGSWKYKWICHSMYGWYQWFHVIKIMCRCAYNYVKSFVIIWNRKQMLHNF